MDPDPAFHFDAGPDPDPTFDSDADLDPDPAFLFDTDPDPDPATLFFPDLDPPMLQNDPLRLPPFHFDEDPDPVFTWMRIRIQLSTLMRMRIWNRIQLPKMMRIRIRNIASFVNRLCIGHKIALDKSEVSQITSQSTPHACHNIGPKPHR